MAVRFVRVLFVVACIIMGAIWARYIVQGLSEKMAEPVRQFPWVIAGGATGAGISIIVLFLLRLVSQEFYDRLAPAIVAVVIAMVVGYGLSQYIMWWWPEVDLTLRVNLIVTLVLLFGFVGIYIGLTRSAKWESVLSAVAKRHSEYGSPKIIDTSVLIDGRIGDIWSSGFIEGTLLVPRFILKELQHIADSADVLRRTKGRRGLDILKAMQEGDRKVSVIILEDDPQDVREVDGKLVRVAREYSAKIITNDYNLNKVAQIEGVAVLNINDLANAVKPAVLPDEKIRVKIIKEGKEASQGVGYLDDGTMVVVDGGKDHLGRNVDVVVTSVLQTSAGRMIFGRLSDILS